LLPILEKRKKRPKKKYLENISEKEYEIYTKKEIYFA
jgi:hypothetical protein